jgi:uncharacterized protein (DUF1501 family)
MYASAGNPMRDGALNDLSMLDVLANVDFKNYVPANGAVYPSSSFGQGMMNIATMIKAAVGFEVFTIDIESWDTHIDMGPVDGVLNDMLTDLCDSLEAFYLDLQSNMDGLVVTVMSEFGRRVAENASAGTDHGHGNCMIVMGGHVAGGQVLTSNWPGLDPSKLDNGDLAITIDYRDIFSEILVNRLSEPNIASVFPNYTPVFRGITN